MNKLQELLRKAVTVDPHIRSIAARAGIHYYREGKRQVETEELAKLLIEEAIAVIETVGYNASNDIDSDTVELFVSHLKQHFNLE